MHSVVETPMFLRAAAGIFSEQERADIVTEIAGAPEAGDIMPGTGGFRKTRVKRAGMGKRGGARVIYLYLNDRLPVFLITVFAKNDKSTLTAAEKKVLRDMASSFTNYGGGQ